MYALQTDRQTASHPDTPKPRDVQVKIGVEAEHDLRTEHKEAGSHRAPSNKLKNHKLKKF